MPVKKSFELLTLPELLPAIHACADLGAPLRTQTGPPPEQPGSYVWSDPADNAVLYVGSAKSLRKRLGNEQAWIDGHEVPPVFRTGRSIRSL